LHLLRPKTLTSVIPGPSLSAHSHLSRPSARCHDGSLRLSKTLQTKKSLTWQLGKRCTKTLYSIIKHYKQLQAHDYCPRFRNTVLGLVGEKIEASSMARASHNELTAHHSAAISSPDNQSPHGIQSHSNGTFRSPMKISCGFVAGCPNG
jgi:hypothetical protein